MEKCNNGYVLDIDDHYKYDRYNNIKEAESAVYYFNIILIDNNRTCPVGVNEIPERCYSKGYVFKKLNEKEIIREFFCVSFTMTI